ncbi:hypothetical protein [Enterococcus sp. 5B3_DIV0040]|uniref:hypothetical protein n=1 Tax=Enterococcus sp. 5B3_DIV0040 TaxID=1834182 RepID=UPI000A3440E6|nr:hypothetical protein [Enterococcus sp. 5B3_DIV0040]
MYVVLKMLKNKKIVIFVLSFVSVFFSTLIWYGIKEQRFYANLGDCVAIALIAAILATLTSFFIDK